MGRLRAQGLAVSVSFVGSSYEPALRRLRRVMHRWDPCAGYIWYHGRIAFEELHKLYHEADGFVFASTCENMPNILLEAMAAGLSIACSNRGPMPEVLGDAGVYFDPEDLGSPTQSLLSLLKDRKLREDLAWRAYARAQQFTCELCARETFDFIVEVAQNGARRLEGVIA